MSDSTGERHVRPLQARCPHCSGPLSEVIQDGVRTYECLVNHRFTEIALLQAHAVAQERTLWGSVVILEEAAILAREAAGHRPERSATLLAQAEEKQRQADFIRGVLDELAPFG